MSRILRSFLTILLTAVLSPGSGYAQVADTGANEEESADVTTGGQVSVWSAPAERKIRPEDAPESENVVWNEENNEVSVAGAGNEHVPFQVIITAPDAPARNEAPEGFFVESTVLRSQAGEVLSSDNINFYLQHYIFLDGKSSPIGDTGYWPDALAPIEVPFSMDAQYDIVSNRPVWVDITIPPNTEAGTYTGTISVIQDSNVLRNIDVQLEVYDFSLPEKTPLNSSFNISKSRLSSYFESHSDDELDKLSDKYYDFLYNHRLEPWFHDMLTPEIEVNDRSVDLRFEDEEYEYYMNELKTNRVVLEASPYELESQTSAEPLSPEFNSLVKKYLSQVASYYERHGWKDRLVFNSPVDEPNSHEEYENTRRWGKLVDEAAPDVPFLSTESPITQNEEWGTLRNHVDNFSVHGNSLNNPHITDVISDIQSDGNEVSWYISCDQQYPQPNYFIDAPAMDPVMVPWITEKYDMKGILYWATVFWSQTNNPWINARTFLSGYSCSGGYILNGEGSLLYPGDDVEQYTGQPNVDGPVSSIRFELLREGVEDYVYLDMLKNLGGEQFANEKVRDHVVDVSAFSRNVEALYLTREDMARRIEELQNH